MKAHTANELRDLANILAPDGSTVLASNVHCGIKDVSGRRVDQAQLSAPQRSFMVLFRAGDSTLLTDDGYLQVNGDGYLYSVDYQNDPGEPRRGTWMEVYCHTERTVS